MNALLGSLSAHSSKAVSEYVVQHPDIVDLAIGLPTFGPPESFTKSLAVQLNHRGGAGAAAVDTYAPAAGDLSLRREIARIYARGHQRELDPSKEILVTNGAVDALATAVHTASEPGDEVLIPDPGYMIYEPLVRLLNRTVRRIPTTSAQGFLADPATTRQLIGRRTRLLILNSPANPTGAVYDRQRITQLCQLCGDHGLRLLHDEVLDCFVAGVEHSPAITLPAGDGTAICVNSLSKRFGMSGWRIGWLACDPDFVAQAVKCHTFFHLAVNHATQKAAAAALADPEAHTYVADQASALRKRGLRFSAKLRTVPGLRVDVLPSGGFYVFVDIREFARTRGLGADRDEDVSRAPAEYLLHTVRVAVIAGDHFGRQGRGFVRMSFAGPESALELAIERLLADANKHHG